MIFRTIMSPNKSKLQKVTLEMIFQYLLDKTRNGIKWKYDTSRSDIESYETYKDEPLLTFPLFTKEENEKYNGKVKQSHIFRIEISDHNDQFEIVSLLIKSYYLPDKDINIDVPSLNNSTVYEYHPRSFELSNFINIYSGCIYNTFTYMSNVNPILYELVEEIRNQLDGKFLDDKGKDAVHLVFELVKYLDFDKANKAYEESMKDYSDKE